MADHPKLFKSELVRAILDGRKTQTRRVIKRLPIHADYGEPDWDKTWIDDSYNPPCLKVAYGGGRLMGGTVQRHWCQYVPGDLLWVRENVRTICYCGGPDFGYGEFCIEYLANNQLVKCPDELEEWWRHNWHVRPSTTIPSIHMPKVACRLWLKVKSVRVERVQEISWQDCKAEGITLIGDELVFNNQTQQHSLLRTKFKALWDSINAKRGYGWEVNLWVFVTEFERIDQ